MASSNSFDNRSGLTGQILVDSNDYPPSINLEDVGDGLVCLMRNDNSRDTNVIFRDSETGHEIAKALVSANNQEAVVIPKSEMRIEIGGIDLGNIFDTRDENADEEGDDDEG